jgi:hypothetical protein
VQCHAAARVARAFSRAAVGRGNDRAVREMKMRSQKTIVPSRGMSEGMRRHWGVPSDFTGKNPMTAHRASYDRERPRRQRNSRPAHQEPESFLPCHGMTIALEMTGGLPVPMLDWPTDLFWEAHLMVNDDWVGGELSMRARPHAGGWTPRHDCAGVAS